MFRRTTKRSRKPVRVVRSDVKSVRPAHQAYEATSDLKAQGNANSILGVAKGRLEIRCDPTPSSRKILIKFPTRGRPDKFMQCLDRWIDYLSGNHMVEFLVSVDDDDPSTLAVVGQIERKHVTVVVGKSQNKVHAVNRDIEGKEFDVLIVASDDMWPVVRGYDAVIVGDMVSHFPKFDGALHYNDGFRGSSLCTLPVMGRVLYNEMGHVYHPEYRSLFCDNEYTDIVRARGRHWYSSRVIIRHEHPANGMGHIDPLYQRNDRFFSLDRETYYRRKRAGFGEAMAASPIILSILIPTLGSRTATLKALVKEMERQSAPHKGKIEIRTLLDNGEASTGAKRNQLVAEARGNYVSFVDDDDMVAPDYIEKIVAAIEGKPGVDCVTFDGEMTTDGNRPTVFKFGLALDDRTMSWGYERRPNHLCAIRTALARRVMFPDKSFGEDSHWSGQLKPLLKTEVHIDSILYFYRFVSQKDPLSVTPGPAPLVRASGSRSPGTGRRRPKRGIRFRSGRFRAWR